VALSGNTGHTTAPHLHYQLERGEGHIVDPLDYHKTDRRTLADKAAFEAEAKRLDALLAAAP
jgi:murein DD-endopeptidase MepM/ murein hydrolase activator NlpD